MRRICLFAVLFCICFVSKAIAQDCQDIITENCILERLLADQKIAETGFKYTEHKNTALYIRGFQNKKYARKLLKLWPVDDPQPKHALKLRGQLEQLVTGTADELDAEEKSKATKETKPIELLEPEYFSDDWSDYLYRLPKLKKIISHYADAGDFQSAKPYLDMYEKSYINIGKPFLSRAKNRLYLSEIYWKLDRKLESKEALRSSEKEFYKFGAFKGIDYAYRHLKMSYLLDGLSPALKWHNKNIGKRRVSSGFISEFMTFLLSKGDFESFEEMIPEYVFHIDHGMQYFRMGELNFLKLLLETKKYDLYFKFTSSLPEKHKKVALSYVLYTGHYKQELPEDFYNKAKSDLFQICGQCNKSLVQFFHNWKANHGDLKATYYAID